jgi:ribose transport system permease protein
VAVRPSAGVLVLLVALCLVMMTQSAAFLTLGNWSNIVNQMVFVLLLTIGMTVVLITGGIDLSVGSVMGLCGGVTASLLLAGVPVGAALVLGVVAGAGLGLVNGLLVTRLGLPDFVATLAMLGIARGLLFLWTNGVPFIGYMTPEYRLLGGLERPFGGFTVPIILAVVVSLLSAALLRYTAIGRHAYGVGSNPDGARLSGVPVARIRVYAYVFSGVMAGLAGVVLAGRTTTVAPTMGIGYEVQAIAAAVIGGAALTGGRGRVLGAVIGALLLTVTANAINIAGVSSTWQQVVTGSVLLLAVILDRVTTMLRTRSLVVAAPPTGSLAGATSA